MAEEDLPIVKAVESSDENLPVLNIYSQQNPGDPAFIVGNALGLRALQAQIENLLSGTRDFDADDYRASDMVKFPLITQVRSDPSYYPSWILERRPYTQSVDYREEAVSPHEAIPKHELVQIICPKTPTEE